MEKIEVGTKNGKTLWSQNGMFYIEYADGSFSDEMTLMAALTIINGEVK